MEKLTWESKHLLSLANAEISRHKEYPKASSLYKENSIKRIRRYIAIRTPMEKCLPEYKYFISAMEKSLELCKEA